MKNYLKTVLGVMALTSVSTGLQATASAVISNDEGLQIHSQPHEMTSEIDRLNKNAVASDNQSQSTTVEMSSPTTAEAFLEQVRVNSRMQAAEAAYNLSILAANRKDFTLAHTLIEESIQLNQSNPNYYTQDHPYVQQAIRNLTDLDVERGSNAEKDRMYDELLREFSSYLPKHKGVTADTTPPSSELRIRRF